MCHAKGERECEIRLPQLHWFIPKSFAVHKAQLQKFFTFLFPIPPSSHVQIRMNVWDKTPPLLPWFFLLDFSPVLLQVALLLLAAVSSYDILVPACASESDNRAAAILDVIAENAETLHF